MSDQSAREAIATELDTTFLVEAAAGTGKTRALVGRIVALVETGRTTIDRIVAVTFTEAAAAQLKNRIRERLDERRGATELGEEKIRLANALRDLDRATLGTIHALCGDILRERPIEAALDPSFELGSASGWEEDKQHAFKIWFERAVADPPEGLERFLARTLEKDTHAVLLGYHAMECLDDPDTPWNRPAFDRRARIDEVVATVDAMAALHAEAALPHCPLTKSLRTLHRNVSQEIARAEHDGAARDYSAIEARLVALAEHELWSASCIGQAFSKTRSRAEVHAQWHDTAEAVRAFARDANADLACALHEDARAFAAFYRSLRRRGLEPSDLLVLTRAVLVTHERVRHDFQQRFSHVFIDEFQDTDPLQTEILMLLSASDPGCDDWRKAVPPPGKLFLVGDPKQAIYAFRNANISYYEEVKALLLAQGARLLTLSTSYRAVPAIQRVVNAAFRQVMTTEEAHQAEYVPLEPHRTGIAGQPSVLAVPIGAGRRFKAMRIAWPQRAAAVAAWLVRDSGWQVASPEGPRPIQPSDICCLYKNQRYFGSDIVAPIVDALHAHGLPTVRVGARTMGHPPEIRAMLHVLTAIEWPNDALAVHATLRGPFFAFTENDILGYRAAHGAPSPLRLTDPPEDAPGCALADALQALQELHLQRNRVPLATTIRRLLDRTRAVAAIGARADGERALSNLRSLIEQARTYETSPDHSFRGFVEALRADTQKTTEPPALDERIEGVRLMTVHRAKGLQFPIVILCGPTTRLTPQKPNTHRDRSSNRTTRRVCGLIPPDLATNLDQASLQDAAETHRVAYVAATRARDLLVVPTLAGGPLDSEDPRWLAALEPAVYPADAQPVRRIAEGTVALYRPRAGDHLIAWLDARVLPSPGPTKNAGARIRTEWLQASEVPDPEAASYRAWASRRAAVREQATACVPVESVTSTSHRPPPHTRPEFVVIERDAGRPTGSRFGILVHAILAEIDLAADADTLATTSEVQGRIVGAPTEEVQAACVAVRRTLLHPLFQRARNADALRREVPVFLRRPEVVIDGVIDLAFRDASGWTVIELKTHEHWSEHREAFESQVGWYASIIHEATGQPTKPVVVVI